MCQMAVTVVTANRKVMELSAHTEWTTDGFAIVEQTRAGLSRAKADEVARPVGLTDKEMARLTGIGLPDLATLQNGSGIQVCWGSQLSALRVHRR